MDGGSDFSREPDAEPLPRLPCHPPPSNRGLNASKSPAIVSDNTSRSATSASASGSSTAMSSADSTSSRNLAGWAVQRKIPVSPSPSPSFSALHASALWGSAT